MSKEKINEKQYDDKVFLKTKNDGIWETAPHMAFLPYMFAGIGGFFIFMILGFVILFTVSSNLFMYFFIALGVLFLIIVGVVIPVKKNNDNNISKSIGFIKRDNKWYVIKLMYDHNDSGVILNAPSGTLAQAVTLPNNLKVASNIQKQEEYIRQARLVKENYSKALDGILESIKNEDYLEPLYANIDAKIDYILNKNCFKEIYIKKRKLCGYIILNNLKIENIDDKFITVSFTDQNNIYKKMKFRNAYDGLIEEINNQNS